MQDTLDVTLKDMFGSSRYVYEDRALMAKLTRIVRGTLEKQEALAARLRKRAIEAREFEILALEEHRLAMAQIKATIGESRFTELFGEGGEDPSSIIDPERARAALEAFRAAAD